MSNQKREKTKVDILKKYIALASKTKKYPTRADMLKIGYTRDVIRHYFISLENIRQEAEAMAPKVFEGMIKPEMFSTTVFNDLASKAKKAKKFIVTTAVGGAPVDKRFLASLKVYAKKNKAMILVIPANYALEDLNRDLINDPDVHIVFRPLKLNSNIAIDPIKIDPKQVDPAVGLDALGKAEGTVIIGSPKQRRVPVANSNTKHARIIQSTGSITLPRYVPADGIPKRRDRLAQAHHVMGATIVEIVDEKLFHMRAVQMVSNGSFNLLMDNYSKDGVKPANVLAIVQGDEHVGFETDPEVVKAVDEMVKLSGAKYRIKHDYFSGYSINHHEMENQVTRAALANRKLISLEEELMACIKSLHRELKMFPNTKIVMVASNHNEFLDRYLAKGRFEDYNRIIATKLQIAAMEGKNPLKYGLELLGLKDDGRIIWLKRDEDFKLAGFELGAHGDLGANGKRNPGSKGMYKAYGKVIYGHCHYGEMWHTAWSVGTSTFRKLAYNKGASSWDNSQAFVYADGTAQLVTVIDGKWR